jgi:hypothetical protein
MHNNLLHHSHKAPDSTPESRVAPSFATTFSIAAVRLPPPAKGIVTRKGRDSGTEARGAPASRARSARQRGFARGKS